MASRYSDDDFDDDVEDQTTVQSLERAKNKSIARILADHEAHVIARNSVQDVPMGSSWHQRYMYQLWLDRFQAYYTQVCKKSVDTLPTGEEFFQFVVVFVRTNSDVATNKLLHLRTMRRGVVDLDNALSFTYEHWELTKHWRMRIEGVLTQLLEEGLLTLKSSPKEPAGAVVIRRMIFALYEDAVKKGTRSWNATLNDIACLLLLAALGCRTGDIMGETRDIRADLPGLRYSDIDITVQDPSQLAARIKMRSTKGMKLDASQYHYIFLSELSNPRDNILCPIKLILIIAMRSGNVRFKTLDELLAHSLGRNDKLVQWMFPDRPVLCAVSGTHSQTVDYDKLASQQRANRAMIRAFEIMGVTEHASPHSIRYGAANDLTKVPFKPVGHSTDQISDVLAHGQVSRMSGVTRLYTGSFTAADSWTARVELTPTDTPFSKLVHATEDFAVGTRPNTQMENFKKRRAPEEVTDDCDSLELDDELPINRNYHSRKARRQGDKNTTPKRAFSGSSDNPFATSREPTRHSNAESDVSNNTQLRNLGFSIDDVIASQHDANEEDDAIISVLLCEPKETGTFSMGEYDQSLIDALTGGRIDFCHSFSRVNIVRASSKATRLAPRSAEDQSRDTDNTVGPMAYFTLRCPNTPQGCKFRGAKDLYAINQHLLNCRFIAPLPQVNNDQDARSPTPNTTPKDKPVPTRHACPQKGCKRTFARIGDRKVHFREKHELITCWVDGCDDESQYMGETALLVHVKAAHPAKGNLHPTISDQHDALFKCPMAGCVEKFRVYSGRTFVPTTFKKHLKNAHRINDQEEQKRLVPAFPGNPCFYPGCASTLRFPATVAGRIAYNDHLHIDHDVDENEQFEYSLDRVRGYVLPRRPNSGAADMEDDME